MKTPTVKEKRNNGLEGVMCDEKEDGVPKSTFRRE